MDVNALASKVPKYGCQTRHHDEARKTCFTLMLLGALGVFANEVLTDYDHSADFQQYKTYSWMRVKAGDPLWVDRITRAVDAQLAAKGLVESGRG